jgi:NAD(P)-dependent dehydrogenase (short-subunit alcohol dehydrogenase family)
MSGVLVVTGGSRGIGAAISLLGGKRGYKVCVNYSRSKDRAEAIVRGIKDSGGEAIAIQADIAREDDIVRMFREVDKAFGPVTALINNAGVDVPSRDTEDCRLEDLKTVFAVNVFGTFLCAREAIKRMSTERGGKGGVIVNIGSISARYGGLPGDVVYASSKGAVDAFTMGLAREVGPLGIRVACVRPGLIRTEIFDSNIGLDRAVEIAKASTMIGRIGEPEEIANMVLWLCSDDASYVTGTIHDVTGGR